MSASTAKAAPEVREKFGTVLVNLRQAAVFVVDVIEEKTGKRPSMAGFQPGVTTSGGKVAITLNGLSASDMGKLTTEVAMRTTKWVGHAAGLPFTPPNRAPPPARSRWRA